MWKEVKQKIVDLHMFIFNLVNANFEEHMMTYRNKQYVVDKKMKVLFWILYIGYFATIASCNVVLRFILDMSGVTLTLFWQCIALVAIMFLLSSLYALLIRGIVLKCLRQVELS